jgi:hypothetical protein
MTMARIVPREPARRFAACVMAGMGIAVAFHAIMRIEGMSWPWTSFLFQEQDQFNDWYNSVAQAASGDPYYFHGRPALATYFPGAYLLFRVGTGMGQRLGVGLYVAISEALLAIAIFSMWFSKCSSASVARSEHDRETPLLLLLALLGSYPVLFALDRGNIDLWIACGCTVFVATLGGRRQTIGLVALAIGIAAKGYPAAFLGLLVERRDFRGVFVCILATAVISFVALLSFEGNLFSSIDGLRQNLHLFQERYVLGGDSLFATSDPYDAIRLFASGSLSAESVSSDAAASRLVPISAAVLQIYMPCVSLYALVSAVFVLVVPVAQWRRVTAVCLVAIMFPNVANDYKLCCLLPGLLLLLLNPISKRREGIALVLFAGLYIPKSYFFFNAASISMLINPVLLIALALVVMVDRPAWLHAWD